MVLGQNWRERVSGEGFPHDVAQTVLGLRQQLQSEQRGALDPVPEVMGFVSKTSFVFRASCMSNTTALKSTSQ